MDKALKIFAALLLAICCTSAPLAAQDTGKGDAPSDGTDGRRWAVFTINPSNSIVSVDGETYPVRDGLLQLMLAPGSHQYSVCSPFYEDAAGQFELAADGRAELAVALTPLFCYVSVECPVKKARVYIDGQYEGQGRVESGRLMPGVHSVLVSRDRQCIFFCKVCVEKGEKKTVTATPGSYAPRPLQAVLDEEGITLADSSSKGADPEAVGKGSANVHTSVPGAVVLVNGMERGTTPCILKSLQAGVPCRVTLRLAGYKDVTVMVRVRSGKMTDVDVKMKKQGR